MKAEEWLMPRGGTKQREEREGGGERKKGREGEGGTAEDGREYSSSGSSV